MAKHHDNGKGTHKVPEKVQRQNEEAERIAKERAERLLSPAERRADDNTPEATRQPQAEPSLEQRLADIDRRARERAVEEKRQLAAHYLDEARRAFRRAVGNTSDEAVKSAYEDMQRLEKMAGDSSGNGQAAPAAVEGAKRERRSPDSLKADAEKLAGWLRANPGSKGSAATEATGVVVKQPLNVRTFLEKYLPGVKVKTSGEKAGTTYSVA